MEITWPFLRKLSDCDLGEDAPASKTQIMNEPQFFKDGRISIETQIANKHIILKEHQIMNEP